MWRAVFPSRFETPNERSLSKPGPESESEPGPGPEPRPPGSRNDFQRRRRCTRGASERIAPRKALSARRRGARGKEAGRRRISRGTPVHGGEVHGGSLGRLRRRSALTGFYQRRRRHPFDVAKWRRRVGGVSVRTVLDVAQPAYVRNNVSADQRRRR